MVVHFLFPQSLVLEMKLIFVTANVKEGVELYVFLMRNGLTFEQYSYTFTQIFMLYWNFKKTKAVTLHCGKCGRWYGPICN